MPRLQTLAGVVVLSFAAPASALEPASAPPDLAQASPSSACSCRAQGRTFELGESTCLRTAEGPRIAECGMVLNNTSWRFTARPCPES